MKKDTAIGGTIKHFGIIAQQDILLAWKIR